VEDFSDLPARYRTMPSGELLTAEQAHGASGIATAVFVVAAAVMAYWVITSEKTEAPRRRRAIAAARAELARRRNPRGKR